MSNERNGVQLLEIAELVTVKALKVMNARGTTEAGEILRKHQYIDTMYDDLIQSVALSIIENGVNVWIETKETETNGIKRNIKIPTFESPEAKKATYQVIQHELYQMKQKHFKKLYVQQFAEDENGNTEIEIRLYTKSVAEHERTISDIETWEAMRELEQILTDKQIEVLHLKIQGYNQKEIAEKLNVSHVAIIKHEKAIEKKAAELYSIDSEKRDIENAMKHERKHK